MKLCLSAILIIFCTSSVLDAEQYDLQSVVSRVNKLKESVDKSFNEAKTFGAAEVKKAIQDNDRLQKQLIRKINKADHIDDVVEDLAKTLKQMAESYTKVSNLSPRVIENHQKRIRDIRNAKGEMQQIVNQSKRKINEHRVRIFEINEELKRVATEHERQLLETEKRGLEQIIRNSLPQESIYMSNMEVFDKMSKGIRINTNQQEMLFLSLRMNAMVYQSAADTVELRQSATETLQQLEELEDIGSLTDGIEENWKSLDTIIEEIEQQDFKQDTKLLMPFSQPEEERSNDTIIRPGKS